MSVTFSMAEFRDDPQYGTVLWQLVNEDFDVNVSNTNAIAVLERLGFKTLDAGEPGDVAVIPRHTDNLCGECEPNDLLGRAMVGNVGLDDSGIAPETIPGEWFGGGATMTDMGRRAGYFEDTMRRLIRLALEARSRGVMVMWA